MLHKADGERRPALFIDRDGTINVDCPYCHNLSDLHIYEDILPFIKEYQRSGFLIIIVTNQSGINRGLFSLQEFINFQTEVVNQMRERGITVNATYYCPHRPDEMCRCRKPNPGLIYEAMDDFDIDLSRSVVVGDNDKTDGGLAEKTGLKFIKIAH